MTLQEAIKEIEKQHFAFQLPIQMIEFEDGSGFKFNYRLKGENKNRFIDLKNDFVHTFISADKLYNTLKR
jgi:hypothetical protein